MRVLPTSIPCCASSASSLSASLIAAAALLGFGKTIPVGAEDLSAAVGASANRDDNGNWLPTYEMARTLCLAAAAAADVAAIDTVFTDFRDQDGLQRYAANARRDGFSGMLAIHPAQVDIINAAFAPSAAEIDYAEQIVALFDANPDLGTVAMDGKMIDKPHLQQARRLLERAGRAKK